MHVQWVGWVGGWQYRTRTTVAPQQPRRADARPLPIGLHRTQCDPSEHELSKQVPRDFSPPPPPFPALDAQLVHELCTKRIHVTKRDLFYTDVKLFEASGAGRGRSGTAEVLI